jgi:putative phosphoribosyl transferase
MQTVIRAVHDLSQQLYQPCWVNARICCPRSPIGLVIHVHNDQEERPAPLRRYIAEYLAMHRLACCTVGLTQPDEHITGRMILDVESLADRLRGVIEFMNQWDETRGLPMAVFGEDYCGAAAMMVATDARGCLKAAGAVCGRPDLAQMYLPEVTIPTLLIVPGRDRDLLARNERAFCKLMCQSQIAIIGNATRGLRESGAVRACRFLIRRWCQKYVAPATRRTGLR